MTGEQAVVTQEANPRRQPSSNEKKVGCRRRTVSPRHRAAFLEALKEGYSVSHASARVGWDRSTLYKNRQRDSEFAAAWDEAIEAGTDKLEDEARRRAVEGVNKPVIYKGEITESYREYSDTLLMFLLNGRRPERFRQRASIEHTGKGGGPIEHLSVDAIDAEIARLSNELGLES